MKNLNAALLLALQAFLFVLIQVLEFFAADTTDDSEVSENVYDPRLEETGDSPYTSKIREDWES